MPLSIGARLGAYEVLGPLGSGGMGEVYRARDRRLGREVAIKVLPEAFASDSERLGRFEKEARLASNLNHPNIVTVHDIGSEGPISYIAMELVEGETLREILSSGPLPLKRLLAIGGQIADGLSQVHAAGIVHRDLKPENVMVTSAGLVKILDLGLAKAMAPEAGSATQAATQPAETEPGVVMGTVGYMSPEQAAGQPLDFRSDQFSFGSVLYEMATGKRAFGGKTRPEILAAIIRDEPEPIASLNARTPGPLRWIVERCLAKEPRERYASTQDLARDLEDLRARISEAGSSAQIEASGATVGGRPSRRERLAWVVAGALLLTATLSLISHRSSGQASKSTLRFSVIPPQGTVLSTTGEGEEAGTPAPVAVSPDGNRLVFGAHVGDVTRLYVRPLDSFAAQALAGTEGTVYPFWSPSGDRIGFFTGYPHGKLMTISATGGPSETIADAPNPRGASWGRDGTIVFAPDNSGAIFQVSSKGGKAMPATFPIAGGSVISHRFPAFLPDGRHFLYLARRMSPSEKVRDTDVGVFIGSTTSRDTRRLLPDVSSAMYATPGYVLFVRDGALMALPFDAGTLEAGGAPIPVMANVEFSALRSIGTFSASPAGVLAFRTATGPPLLRLAWLNRSGSPAGATEFPEAVIEEMRLSPDGRQAALVLQEARSASGDLWTFDLQRGTRARLTRGNASTTGATAPVFSPDGSRVVVSLGKEEGIEELSALDSSGEGAPETLVSSPLGKTASDWSQDGRFILFEQPGARRNFEIWVYGVSEKRAWPLVQSESTTYFGVFSPDGRWVAYVSNENDQVEVFVRPFTGAGGKQQVSRGVGDGGGLVRWSRDGREIVYQVGDKLIAVDVKGRDRLEFGEPRTLLQFPRGTALWDITPDHQRILIAARTEEAGASPPLSVLTNWAAELKR